MNNDAIAQAKCQKSFELFGDRWNLIIIDALRSQDQRFNCLQRNIGINSATLVNRLKVLEDLKLIERKEQTQDKQSVCYQLTAKGKELVPIIDQILEFSARI